MRNWRSSYYDEGNRTRELDARLADSASRRAPSRPCAADFGSPPLRVAGRGLKWFASSSQDEAGRDRGALRRQ
ncbi:Hypothetical protein NTJ_03191 [Nesidiocoris tenuis]|uniref:Uncharacterized protein n=1 Tax=Nesidiocoris tenuis TaxID=355587 RepID=A0ABN7AEF8_9HEMI|nr:Hypothetical protein NTJ_03191 [Nesidiocoris tenuis]